MMRGLALIAAAGFAAASSPSFEEWATAFGKVYTPEEATLRSKIYAANVKDIEAHNAQGLEWTKGVNQWTDLTGDEWRATVFKGRKTTKSARPSTTIPVVHEKLIRAGLPATVNWTAAGAVTPVKNQGQCGSCWAFATVVAVEGAHAVATGSLVSFSEQQIVSCDINTGDGNDGCNGGDQLPALQWIADKTTGLCTEAEWPYTSGDGLNGRCNKKCTDPTPIKEGVEVVKGNETALMAAIAMQPISLSVDASNDAIWQSYAGGVVTASCRCATEACLDHGVGGAGYGTTAAGVDYWLVKNSWGTSWGEKGYIRLARGAAYNPHGQCGVQIDNQYAVV